MTHLLSLCRPRVSSASYWMMQITVGTRPSSPVMLPLPPKKRQKIASMRYHKSLEL